MMHELAHIAGLGHSRSPAELMYESTFVATDWGRGDRAGLRRVGRQEGCLPRSSPLAA
jgi:hypothetical protein